MRERVITFGDNGNLVGILAEPNGADKKSDVPCVLILNAGILHHVGPFRLHVIAARRFAEQGYASLRFDIAGIGDSLSIGGKGYDEERVILDIQSAMDAMCRKKSITDFILMGLCTGAANAHRVAIVDDRIKGGVFLDGYAYPAW
jgi:dienelactone hydrolase